MGQGKKTMREMNRLIKVLKRNRALKKTSRNSYARPEFSPTGEKIVYDQPANEQVNAQVSEPVGETLEAAE
jgi:hypothetical protein